MCTYTLQVMGAQWYDGNISLPGCDKNMPGTIIAMARLNRPAIMIYGGTIKPGMGSTSDEPLDIVSAFQSYGERPLYQSSLGYLLSNAIGPRMLCHAHLSYGMRSSQVHSAPES